MDHLNNEKKCEHSNIDYWLLDGRLNFHKDLTCDEERKVEKNVFCRLQLKKKL